MDDHVVPFNVPMSAAHRGQVADPIDHAFTGDLATREKASIRIGVREEIVLQAGRKQLIPSTTQLLHVESSGYRARQHNLQRASVPIMRGQLAMVIAEEVRLVIVRSGRHALQRSIGAHALYAGGTRRDQQATYIARRPACSLRRPDSS